MDHKQRHELTQFQFDAERSAINICVVLMNTYIMPLILKEYKLITLVFIRGSSFVLNKKNVMRMS